MVTPMPSCTHGSANYFCTLCVMDAVDELAKKVKSNGEPGTPPKCQHDDAKFVRMALVCPKCGIVGGC